MLSTKINGDILKPQFMDQLNYLRDKSKSLAEKEKCDQLRACLLISSKLGSIKKPSRPGDKTPLRPKTAMAALGGNLWDPYVTSMNRDYTKKDCSPTIAVRPKTSQGYRNPYFLCDPIGKSMYSDEFGWKPYSSTEPIRAATSSGTRNHRPIPAKTFAALKLPHQEKMISEDSRSPWSKPPSIAEVQRLMASQYVSTYKGDYLGIPQGYQMKYAIDSALDWKKEIPKPLASETRFHYQVQPQPPELANFTPKYKCFPARRLAAKGVVPAVTQAYIQNQQNKTQLTTYQRHFGKEYVDLSDLVASLDPAELERYLQSVPNEERRMLEKFLKAFRETDNQQNQLRAN